MASEDSNLDFILDAALREYSNHEPRVGFEGRILRYVQSARPARRLWLRLLPAVAAIPLAIAILHRDSPKIQPMREVSRAVKQPVPPQSPPSIVKVVKRSPKLPELAKFPEPVPLTAEERALLHFVQNQPEQEREALSLSARIEEITIEPLKIDELR